MNGHRRIGLAATVLALAATTLGTAAASAATPTTDAWTNHYDGPVLDCPGFTIHGDWIIRHELTVYVDAAGNATGDLERIAYTGRFYNPDTLVSVADRGTKRFRDTFAADGSIASTDFTFERTDRYVGEAGRVVLGPQDANGDQSELRVVGHLGFNDVSITALCAALAG
jgi:hypothetical protein